MPCRPSTLAPQLTPSQHHTLNHQTPSSPSAHSVPKIFGFSSTSSLKLHAHSLALYIYFIFSSRNLLSRKHKALHRLRLQPHPNYSLASIKLQARSHLFALCSYAAEANRTVDWRSSYAVLRDEVAPTSDTLHVEGDDVVGFPNTRLR